MLFAWTLLTSGKRPAVNSMIRSSPPCEVKTNSNHINDASMDTNDVSINMSIIHEPSSELKITSNAPLHDSKTK